MKWIRVTRTENIPLREGRTVDLGPDRIAIFNLGGRFVAIQDRCPHGDGPLSDGIVGGTTVTCPLHAWKVCLESGRVTKGCGEQPVSVCTYPVKVEEGVVLVQVDSPVVRAA